MKILSYDPGKLPIKHSPRSGEVIIIEVEGLPPFKDISSSIRNPNHKIYNRFVKLRQETIKIMDGRAWYKGPIQFDLKIEAPAMEKGKSIIDYLGGVMDTLDGSHGPNFTYLPIVYEDDCQVASGRHSYHSNNDEKYIITITFLSDYN